MATKAISLIISLLVVPTLVYSQGQTSVRVLQAAAVLEQPQGSADVVGTVNPGQVLDVLDERDGWYLVRPPVGSAQSWRTGWVNVASVESIEGNVAPAVAQTESVPVGPSTGRQGFIIGVGGGGGLHRAPIFSVITDGKIGYAPTDQLLVYYTNQLAWSQNARYGYDAVGITGVGVSYMFNPTSPSGFVTGAIGASVGTRGTLSASNAGLGLIAGVGYEFARHWSMGGEVMFLSVGDADDHMVFLGTIDCSTDLRIVERVFG